MFTPVTDHRKFIIYGLIVLANLIAESSLGLLQIFDRFRRVAAIQLIQSAFTLILIVLTFVMQGNLLGILLSYVAGKVVGAVGLTVSALLEASHQWGQRRRQVSPHGLGRGFGLRCKRLGQLCG